MCGIAAAPGRRNLAAAVAALAHRGPDAAQIAYTAGCTLGHTRLAIRDPLPRSGQPYTDGPVTIAYNGELFNTARARAMVEDASPGRTWGTTGDTEVMAAILAVLGPAALAEIDGMFAVAWADERTPGVLHLARDRYGEIPLRLHRCGAAASELKAFTALGLRCGSAVTDVSPGQHWQVTAGGTVTGEAWAVPGCVPGTGEDAPRRLAAALGEACRRRLVADVPVCALISGGIDSAVIAAELSARHPGLACYTAVLDPASADLRAARLTAGYLGVKLTEVRVPPPDADDLARTVAQIEMPHKAQVEIGWACLHLAAAIAADGYKVTYSGEGSDELWASYGFAWHAVQSRGWYAARLGLLIAQARKNFPRLNKVFMSAGVEARLPFLDPGVVDLALSLPRDAVATRTHPKAVLAAAYDGRLPASILARPKVAFQDGMGLKAAIAAHLPDPRRFYRAEYARAYG